MIHYVGIATHIITGEFYVFKRKLPKGKTPETDFYIGSGFYPDGFSMFYKRKFFNRDIIEVFDNNEVGALNLESNIIEKLMCDNCMNLSTLSGKQNEPNIRYNSNPIYINNKLYKSNSYAAEKIEASKSIIIKAIKSNRKVVKNTKGIYYIIGKVNKIPSQKELKKLYEEERTWKISEKDKLNRSINAKGVPVIINNIKYSNQAYPCSLLDIPRTTLRRKIKNKETEVKDRNGNIHIISY